jgi:hypothetical protein
MLLTFWGTQRCVPVSSWRVHQCCAVMGV